MTTPGNRQPQEPDRVGPPEEREFTPPVVVSSAPTDANALREHHFKRLLSKQ